MRAVLGTSAVLIYNLIAIIIYLLVMDSAPSAMNHCLRLFVPEFCIYTLISLYVCDLNGPIGNSPAIRVLLITACHRIYYSVYRASTDNLHRARHKGLFLSNKLRVRVLKVYRPTYCMIPAVGRPLGYVISATSAPSRELDPVPNSTFGR